MPEYQQWESWLTAYYFCPEKQGLDVVLYANKQIIVDIGRKNNVRDVVLDDDEIYHDFIDTVKLYNPAKISHYTPEQICLSAYHVYQKSRILVANHPPLFLAYLVLFVLADVISTDDRLHPNAYYERLRLLIGANGKGVLPDFYKMDELWKALERWSSAITKGSRGHTRLLTMTGHVHINYPRSQALLNSEDRDKLPDIFYEAGFEPGTPPEPGELGSVLLEYGKSVLHKRVIKDTSKKSFKRLHRYRYSPTACYGNNEVHLHPFEPRRLSLREAMRIQGIPDEYELPEGSSLTIKFKLIGNGVPVPLAYNIAQHLIVIFRDNAKFFVNSNN